MATLNGLVHYVLLAAIATVPTFACAAQAPRVVSGAATDTFPTVGLVLLFEDDSKEVIETICSGVLVGCHTLLTAAHCVCPDGAATGPACVSAGTFPSSRIEVFFQHAGTFTVENVTINPTFEFSVAGDIAVVTLAQPVTGIRPSPLNLTSRLRPAAEASFVGFGRTSALPVAIDDAGLKRFGSVRTTPCVGDLPDESLICWASDGTKHVGSCEGDSGGPLFVDRNGVLTVAALSSGGESDTCTPPDLLFATDVYLAREWLRRRVGEDLSSLACGDVAAVGTSTTTVESFLGQLSHDSSEARWSFEVPEGTRTLRVALNSQVYCPAGDTNDFDLFLKFDAPADAETADCEDIDPTALGYCEIAMPRAGRWHVLVENVAGEASFQLTATFLGARPPACDGDCDGDGQVAAVEVATAISMALDSMSASACVSADSGGDGRVGIDDVVTIVQQAKDACVP